MTNPATTNQSIPFNKPFIVGKELYYISQAVLSGQLAGNGLFTKKCQHFLQETYGGAKVLLTTSCTHALEMAAILCDIQPGDEIIMPSFTFVSTANAYVLRGARPVFVDIRPDTLNLDEGLIESAITPRTRAICPVHYAGVGCEMNEITALARARGLRVVEDAAQGMNSTYRDRWLGTIGDLAAFSFHETKNFISGEGGALIVNDPELCERAEIIWEKGTNRSKFFRGEVDKYTWVDIGSSYLPSELIAAFLYAQLENSAEITRRRLNAWHEYRDGLRPLEEAGILRLPIIPDHCSHNGHMFYILLDTVQTRDRLMAQLKSQKILSVFHYIPLHDSPMGQRLGYRPGQFPVTEEMSGRLLRLPMFFDLKTEEQDRVIAGIRDFFHAPVAQPAKRGSAVTQAGAALTSESRTG